MRCRRWVRDGDGGCIATALGSVHGRIFIDNVAPHHTTKDRLLQARARRRAARLATPARRYEELSPRQLLGSDPDFLLAERLRPPTSSWRSHPEVCPPAGKRPNQG